MPELAGDTATATWIGRRERQEDAVVAHRTPRGDAEIVVLSDGMGGHSAGDVASQIIVAEVLGRMVCAGSRPGKLSAEGDAALMTAVTGANETLCDHVRTARPREGMGGTVVSALITGGELRWISVGDSPLYLFRRDRLWRLNADHSLAPQIDLMAAQGELDPELARNHPDRGVLTSALTGGRIPKVDCPGRAVPLRPDDIVIVASDGIQVLGDAALTRLVRRNARREARAIAKRIMAAVRARNASDQDNVALAVVRMVAVGAEAPAPVRSRLAGLLGQLRPRRAQDVGLT